MKKIILILFVLISGCVVKNGISKSKIELGFNREEVLILLEEQKITFDDYDSSSESVGEYEKEENDNESSVLPTEKEKNNKKSSILPTEKENYKEYMLVNKKKSKDRAFLVFKEKDEKYILCSIYINKDYGVPKKYKKYIRVYLESIYILNGEYFR